MTVSVATMFGLRVHRGVAHEARRVTIRMLTGNDEEGLHVLIHLVAQQW